MNHSYLDDLFDRIEDEIESDEDLDIDIPLEIWEGGLMVEDHPICPYGEGDENDLCTKEQYGCYFIGCEYADIE